MLQKIVLWYRVESGGDGSAHVRWYLSEEEAKTAEQDDPEPFCESNPLPAETHVGSNLHEHALAQKRYEEEDKKWWANYEAEQAAKKKKNG